MFRMVNAMLVEPKGTVVHVNLIKAYGGVEVYLASKQPQNLCDVTVPPHPGYRPAASSVHYTTSCKHSLVLLRLGEINARNMLR